jgi:two-component system nitrate/nitrite response regulator NarL
LTSKPPQNDSGPEMIRILLVDDLEPFRSLTASILQKHPKFQIVGVALDGQEAVQKAQELKPDLVVLDIGLPKLNGIEAARQIRLVSPDSKILFFTGNDYPEIVREALEAGTGGYVIKVDGAGELMAAVEAVLQGKRYVSKRLANRGFLGDA